MGCYFLLQEISEYEMAGDLPDPGIKPTSPEALALAGRFFITSPWKAHYTSTGCHSVKIWSEVKVSQLCPTLCTPKDYIVHGILQARILDWIAIPFSRGSSQPRDRTQVSLIAGEFFTSWATGETQEYWSG